MVATLDVQRITGPVGTPVRTTQTSIRLRTDDANTADNTNPVPIDTVLRRSYWASICLLIGGTFTEVSNVRHFSDGAIGFTYGTLGELKRGNRDTGDNGVPDGSYVQASGTIGLDGADLIVSHTYYSGQTVKSVDLDADTTPGAVIDSATHTIAERTKHVVLQVEVDTDATQGVQTAETLTWLVDEI